MIINNIPHLRTTQDSRYSGLPVMCNDLNPCYLDMLEKAYRELTCISARYLRIVVVRLDFKLAEDSLPGKVDIAKFRKSFIRRLEREFNSKVAYQWTREFGKSKYNTATHWHWWVAIKASEKHRTNRQADHIAIAANDVWKTHTANNKSSANRSGYFFLSRKFFSPESRKQQQFTIANGPPINESDVFINRKIIARREDKQVLGGQIDECFFALSYMSKVYTKTRTKNTKGKPVFKNSNLNTKDKKKGRTEEIENNLSQIREWLKVPLESTPLLYGTDAGTLVPDGENQDESTLVDLFS